MTATLPPCACGHLHCLHIPAAASAGRCTGVGCDCRSYVRRTTRPDEHMTPAGDYNPPDVRAIANGGVPGGLPVAMTRQDLARLVLREREAHIERGERLIVAASELIRLADARDKAEAERDQARAALADANEALAEVVQDLATERGRLARVEAFADLCTDITAREIRAAIAGDPPAAGYDADMGTNGPVHSGEHIGGTIPGVTGYTVAELRAMWQSMLDGSVWPLREKRLACMAVGLVNQLQPLRDDLASRGPRLTITNTATCGRCGQQIRQTDGGPWDHVDTGRGACGPTHLPLDEVIEIAADLARRAATPPERTDG